MAEHIVQHIDGPYRRCFVTGRTPKPKELKYVMQPVSMPPNMKANIKNWKQLTGKSFSTWVQDEMYKVIYSETV